MRAANGAGLAAPQVDYPVAIAPCASKTIRATPTNPISPDRICESGDYRLSDETRSLYEGCLSVPDCEGALSARLIRVQAVDRLGEPIDFEVKGLTAGTFNTNLITCWAWSSSTASTMRRSAIGRISMRFTGRFVREAEAIVAELELTSASFEIRRDRSARPVRVPS